MLGKATNSDHQVEDGWICTKFPIEFLKLQTFESSDVFGQDHTLSDSTIPYYY